MGSAVLRIELKGLKRISSGKVRDIFEAGDGLLLVASDRLSAFDVVLNQGIPGKGAVLTRLSAFWFGRLSGVAPHHLRTTDLARMPQGVRGQEALLGGRTMFVERLEIVPVECVVRGYLAGSGWKEYRERRSVCGVPLPSGLRESERLPEPIFTPTTKAKTGHDMPMSYSEVEMAVGATTAAKLRTLSLALYRAGAEYAEQRGILLADTKFEFGKRADGTIVLADEALTPDSSRYWDQETYEPGRAQDSFDKQIVRDWLEKSGWNKSPPAPDLPPAIIQKTSRRYEEIAQRLMGV